MTTFWDPIIEHIDRKFSCWQYSYISKGGRLTLIQVVLNSLPTYYLSLFKAPVAISKLIEKKMRKFLCLEMSLSLSKMLGMKIWMIGIHLLEDCFWTENKKYGTFNRLVGRFPQTQRSVRLLIWTLASFSMRSLKDYIAVVVDHTLPMDIGPIWSTFIPKNVNFSCGLFFTRVLTLRISASLDFPPCILAQTSASCARITANPSSLYSSTVVTQNKFELNFIITSTPLALFLEFWTMF